MILKPGLKKSDDMGFTVLNVKKVAIYSARFGLINLISNQILDKKIRSSIQIFQTRSYRPTAMRMTH